MTTTRMLAYLDPGSAGVIVQMIGGGLAAVAVALKLYGRKLLKMVHIGKRDSEAVPQRETR